LVNHVYSEEDFDARVEAYVAGLASKSASAVSLGKHMLYHMDGMAFETALEAGIRGNAMARMTEDARRGIERFLRKG
jgi:1,4-dihydroxy-2-naphthoyl-CoA synthase